MEDKEAASKRMRSSNFSENEKSHLINIVAKYKNIIENKETNKATNVEKNAAWEKIAAEFNSSSTSTHYRAKDVLKRFYENKKKELRKKVADAKVEIKKTGGGPSAESTMQPFEEVLLSITNEKTVFGMISPYGGDVSSEEDVESKNDSNDIAIIYEYEPENLNENTIFEKNWKKYKPADLAKPISSPLKKKDGQKQVATTARLESNAEKSPNRQSLEESKEVTESQSMQSSSHKQTPQSIASNPASKRRRLASDRRRPTVQVKALTSSELSAKYNQLLDIRLQVAQYSRDHMIQQLEQEKAKHEKEIVLLDLKIQVEKERLQTKAK